MRTFATFVIYERHGQPAIGYRAETIDQIANGDVAEGTHGSWELRCWTCAGESPRYGVSASELAALISATFRVIDHCLADGSRLEAIHRFQCFPGGAASGLPASRPLPEHLEDWSNQAALSAVFLQIQKVGVQQLRAIEKLLQREVEAMVKIRDELIERSAPAFPRP